MTDATSSVPPPIVTAKGANGTVTFDGRMVTITRSGGLASLTIGSGEKRIPVSSITAVQWKKPGFFAKGFMAFTVPGAIETRSQAGRRAYDATKDENAVLVGKKSVDDFLRLRDAIEAAMG